MSGCRGVAQPGSALAWGARGPEFESRRPDQTYRAIRKRNRPGAGFSFFSRSGVARGFPMPDPATPGPGACRDLRAGLPGSELRMRSSPGSRLVVQPFLASKPGFSPAFPPFPACNHRNQISKSDAMLRLAGLRLPRTANGHRVPALKHPLRRIELRSARSALDWRNGVAIWRFGAANRRGRARSRLPVARNDPDKDGNHPDEFTITRKQPRIGRIMRGEYE